MVTDNKLPERQQKVLDFVVEYLRETGYPPTVREIGEAIGVTSTSLVTYYLKRLETLGYLTREPSVSRGIRLTGEDETEVAAREFAPDLIAIPYLGYVGASTPLSVEALAGDETMELNRALFGRDAANLFALTVRGDSMIDALINDGDLVIMRHQERVENGEMAAVWLDNQEATTLKKVYYEGRQVRLQPANPTMDPIYVPAENLRVQGKVVMVIRQLE